MQVVIWSAFSLIASSEVIERGNEGVASSGTMRRMLQWFESHGGVVGSGVAAESSESGWCLRTTRDVAEGEVLLRIPSAVGLHASVYSRTMKRMLRRFRQLGIPLILRKLVNDLGYIELMLVLIHEKVAGRESHWEPYIKSLPKTVPQMKLLEEFRKNRTFLTTWQRLHDILRLDHTVIQCIAMSLPRLFMKKRRVPRGRSAWTLTSWAYFIVLSRNYKISRHDTLPGQLFFEWTTGDSYQGRNALLPVWDLFNHEGRLEGNFQDIVFDAGETGSQSIIVLARHALPPRYEVRFKYVDGYSCEYWLSHYGFVPNDLPMMIPGVKVPQHFDTLEEPRIAAQMSRFQCFKETDLTLQEGVGNTEACSILPPRLLICLRLLFLAWHASRMTKHDERNHLLDLASDNLATKFPTEAKIAETPFWATLNDFASAQLKLSKEVLQAVLSTKVHLPKSVWRPVLDCAQFRSDVLEIFRSAAYNCSQSSGQLSLESSGVTRDSDAKCAAGEKISAFYAGSIGGEHGSVECVPQLQECWFPGHLNQVASDGVWHVTWLDNDENHRWVKSSLIRSFTGQMCA